MTAFGLQKSCPRLERLFLAQYKQVNLEPQLRWARQESDLRPSDYELGLGLSTQYMWGINVHPVPYAGNKMSIKSMFSMSSILVAVR